MINTVSELRDALMIDLESDSDIAMLDASCEIAEYAMESAAFEYDGVNTAAMEAADDSVLAKAKKFASEIVDKVKKFCAAAIRTIRMILPRLKMFVNMGINKLEAGKAKRIQEKIGNFSGDNAAKTIEIDSADKEILDSGMASPKGIVTACLDDAKNSDKVGTEKDVFSKGKKQEYLMKSKATGTAKVGLKEVKKYIDTAAKYLNELNDSTKLEKEWVDAMDKSGNVTGVRRAMISAYNVVTNSVRKYYHMAVDTANKYIGTTKEKDKK